ncbi:MAG: DMT family transporter [Pseudomonadota bacterium]
MSIGVFLAVLLAAALHATWNALIKFGGDKLQGMFLFSLGHMLLGLLLIAFSPLPDPASWGWLALSIAIHLVYQLALVAAYERGDLSRVYPIARGSAPLMVLLFSLVFLADQVGLFQIGGIILVSCGILLMALGVFRASENRSLIGFALLSALGTAGYSIADGLGARASGSATAYIGWLMVLGGLVFMAVAYAKRGKAIYPTERQVWIKGIFAGFLSLVAYWIAVWAMTQAPIALVTALRETSVLFAVAIGVIFLKEKFDRQKLFATLLIIAGIIAIRV